MQLLFGLGDATEPVDEVHVPRGAAELPVSGGLQSGIVLHGDDVENRLVLDLVERSLR